MGAMRTPCGQAGGVQLLHRVLDARRAPRWGSRRGASARCPRRRPARPSTPKMPVGGAAPMLHPADVAHEDRHAASARATTMFSMSATDADQAHAAHHHATAAGCPAARRRRSGCWRSTASAIWSMERLYLSSASGSISIWYCLIRPPNGDHVGHAGHLQEARLDHPVLAVRAVAWRRSRRLRARSGRVRRWAWRAARAWASTPSGRSASRSFSSTTWRAK